MRLQYSRQNILFLKPIATFSTVFAITPIYSFHHKEITNKLLFRCYSLLLACLTVSASVFSLYSRHQIFYRHSNVFAITLDILFEMGGVATYLVTTFGASYWNMNTWQILINQLHHIESANHLINDGIITNSILKNPIFILSLASFYFAAIFVLQNLLWFDYTIYYTSTLILYYLECVLANVIFNIVLSIKQKYSEINNLITRLNFCNTGDEALARTVRKVKVLYLETGKVVEIFNGLFGWPLFLLLSHSVLQVLDCLSIFIGKYDAGVYGFLISSLFGIGNMFGPIMVIFCCDLTIKESRKLLMNCFRLEQSLPLGFLDISDLRSLQSLLQTQRPVFIAAGFFEINRSTLLSLISTTTTYFIIAIQFNSL